MAGNGALDLSIRIMGKVDPSLAKSISQVKGLTGSLTGGLRTTNSLASTVANTIGVIGKAGLGLAATLTGSVLVGMKQVTNEASKLEAQMAPVVRYVNGLADASGKVSDAIADNGKTFKQNYSDMENYIQRLSMDIPRTTEQLTTMSAALGQSGKDVTEQTKTGILRDTAVAATAMDLDDQTAGDYMAKWEASFTKRDADGNKVNYSHDDVMRLMNQINYLGANNATTAAEIASSVNKSASIGQLAGVDPSTTAAIATAMLKMAIKAYSYAKDGSKTLSKNFHVREFKCKDGSDPIFIDDELVTLLQKIRDHFGKAVNINSAFRTASHNARQKKSSKYSQHLYGKAADIWIAGVSVDTLAAYVETLLPGKGGIGRYYTDGFVHVDVREVKSRWVMQ